MRQSNAAATLKPSPNYSTPAASEPPPSEVITNAGGVILHEMSAVSIRFHAHCCRLISERTLGEIGIVLILAS
jgi:hypothetical protein